MGKVSCPECNCVFFTEPVASRFIPPTVEEVANYCKQRGNAVDPQGFVDHYSANGWVRGKTKLKNWKACVHTWEKSAKVAEAIQGPVCPLCSTYRLTGKAIVCQSCGYYCRRCHEQTARLIVVKRKDGSKTAICGKCLDELMGK